jgi:hypothetical protein
MIKKLITPLLCILVAASVTRAYAQPQTGDWEFTLGGSGDSNSRFSRGGFGLNGSAGYFFTPNIELGLRQGVNYDAHAANDEWAGSTRAAADWHFLLGKFVPFVGADFGLDYTEHYDRWGIGPEAGFKYYVQPRTFIMAMGEYRWNFNRFRDVDNRLDDGHFVFTVGIGFNVGGKR